MLWRVVGAVELLASEAKLIHQVQISVSVQCHPSVTTVFRSAGMVNTERNLRDFRGFPLSFNSLYWLSISLHQLN